MLLQGMSRKLKPEGTTGNNKLNEEPCGNPGMYEYGVQDRWKEAVQVCYQVGEARLFVPASGR